MMEQVMGGMEGGNGAQLPYTPSCDHGLCIPDSEGLAIPSLPMRSRRGNLYASQKQPWLKHHIFERVTQTPTRHDMS